MPPVVIDIRRADDRRDVVHRAVQALAEGELVAFPTETVYGIGASACHAHAVARLVEAKGRGAGVPMAIAIKGPEEATDYVPDMNALARRLARRCWPGPVTLVVDCPQQGGLERQLPGSVRDVVCPQSSLGMRVPANPMLLDVLRMVAGPIVLTSANKSGEREAVTAQEVVAAVGDSLALVLDDGPCRYGQPSSVVRVRGRRLEILREGVVATETLRRLSTMLVLFVCTGNTCRSPMAAALLRRQLADRLKCGREDLETHGVIVGSAGVAAGAGAPSTPEAGVAMSEYGIDLSSHESRPLTDHLVRHADLIITMTRGHRQAILEHWPQAAGRTRMLYPAGEEVVDPIGGSTDIYRACARQIDQGVSLHLREIEDQLMLPEAG